MIVDQEPKSVLAPEDYTILLACMNGKTIQEISDELKIAKQKVYQARRRIRLRLGRDIFGKIKTQQGVKGILTQHDYRVLECLAVGKTSQQTASELGITLRAVQQSKYRIKRKLGEKQFAKTCEELALKMRPRGFCAQKSVLWLQQKLSPIELTALIMVKVGWTYKTIAEVADTTYFTVQTAIKRVKEKLGKDKFAKFIGYSGLIHGLELPGDNYSKFVAEPSQCSNCKYFVYAIRHKKEHEVCCMRRHQTTLSIHASCNDYQEKYIPTIAGKFLVKEVLEDKGFLQMAFDFNVKGYRPTTPIEKSQYAIAGIGFQDYHQKRRLQTLRVLTKAQHNTIVQLNNEDKQAPGVKKFLKTNSLLPIKIEFDSEEYPFISTSATYALNRRQACELQDLLRVKTQ